MVGVWLPLALPQPIAPATTITIRSTIITGHRRRRFGNPRRMTAANAVLPPIQRILHPNGATFTEPLLAVVCTVNTAFAVPFDAMTTLPGSRLHVGRPCAPGGEAVKAQAIFMVPECVLPADRTNFAVALVPGETLTEAGAAIWGTLRKLFCSTGYGET
jgi:hypothetical protein